LSNYKTEKAEGDKMNIRRIAQAIRLMESFNEDEKRLLNTLMMASTAEREVLVESLQPQSKSSSKKSSKKSAGKSSRASSLERQIKANTAHVKADGDEFPDLLGGHEPCAFKFTGGEQCAAASDSNIHHLKTVVGYHEFQPTPLSTKDDSYEANSAAATSATGD
jgi:hypothetical protein